MDSIPLILVTLGALLLLGMAAEFVGRRAHVPGVSLLILLGLLIGPMGLDLLSQQRSAWFPLLTHVALVMIGFLLGNDLTRDRLREHGREILWVSVSVTLVTGLVVCLGLLLVGVPLPSALLLGAITTATDPAATLAVVRESRAEGPFTRSLLGIVAIDDVWGIGLFSVLLAVAAALSGQGDAAALLLVGAHEVGGGLLLGAALGVPMALLTGRLRPGEPTLIEALGFVLLCGGLAAWLEVSLLLSAIAMGATVANLARHHERPFREIEHLERPFLVIFFVLAGAALELSSLEGAGLLAVVYVLLRLTGRPLGAYLGARAAGSPAAQRRYLGLALLPQAGVALGMALLVVERFPELGRTVLPLTIVATVAFELAGPLATRFALRRAGELHAAPEAEPAQ